MCIRDRYQRRVRGSGHFRPFLSAEAGNSSVMSVVFEGKEHGGPLGHADTRIGRRADAGPYDSRRRPKFEAVLYADLRRVEAEAEKPRDPKKYVPAAARLVLPEVQRRLEASYTKLALHPAGVTVETFSQVCDVDESWVRKMADSDHDGLINDVEFVSTFVGLALAESIPVSGGSYSGTDLFDALSTTLNATLIRYLDGLDGRLASTGMAMAL
eukprot:TRINITY_DN2741_c0_g1_i1.p1 TRINITY_DN2741_c0_g1~~TRINITY_DN2741_c0_g1_i1.p1  ORF type:complete len:213 (+),score=32.90 TRINITY_DN2741_c0_g1_i1:79-717(+)